MKSVQKNVKALLVLGSQTDDTDLVIALAEPAVQILQMKCAEQKPC